MVSCPSVLLCFRNLPFDIGIGIPDKLQPFPNVYAAKQATPIVRCRLNTK